MSVVDKGPKERCTQLIFRDDRKFQFRSMPVERGFVLETQKEKVIRAWMHPYKVLKFWGGGLGAKRDMVLISFNRDIILDPFKQLSPAEAPEIGPGLIKSQITEIATTTLYAHIDSVKRTLADKWLSLVGACMVIATIALAIRALLNMGG